MHCIVLFCLSENRTGKKKIKNWQNHLPASWFQKGCILGGTCLSTVLMRNWYSREDILIWNTLSRVYRQKQKDISYGLDRCHSLWQPLSPSGMQWVGDICNSCTRALHVILDFSFLYVFQYALKTYFMTNNVANLH